MISILYDERAANVAASYRGVISTANTPPWTFNTGDPVADFRAAVEFERGLGNRAVLFSSSVDQFVFDADGFEWDADSFICRSPAPVAAGDSRLQAMSALLGLTLTAASTEADPAGALHLVFAGEGGAQFAVIVTGEVQVRALAPANQPTHFEDIETGE
jgi:hypothetical protein